MCWLFTFLSSYVYIFVLFYFLFVLSNFLLLFLFDLTAVMMIFFCGVRCTFWSLGESLKHGGIVNNFVIAAFCYHLYSLSSGYPDVSKCHYFFSNISVSVFISFNLFSTLILSLFYFLLPIGSTFQRSRQCKWRSLE
jgi:hypothetical protein